VARHVWDLPTWRWISSSPYPSGRNREFEGGSGNSPRIRCMCQWQSQWRRFRAAAVDLDGGPKHGLVVVSHALPRPSGRPEGHRHKSRHSSFFPQKAADRTIEGETELTVFPKADVNDSARPDDVRDVTGTNSPFRWKTRRTRSSSALHPERLVAPAFRMWLYGRHRERTFQRQRGLNGVGERLSTSPFSDLTRHGKPGQESVAHAPPIRDVSDGKVSTPCASGPAPLSHQGRPETS